MSKQQLPNDKILWNLYSLTGSRIFDPEYQQTLAHVEFIVGNATMLTDTRTGTPEDTVRIMREKLLESESGQSEEIERLKKRIHNQTLLLEDCHDVFGKLQEFFNVYSSAAQNAQKFNDENLYELIDDTMAKLDDRYV